MNIPPVVTLRLDQRKLPAEVFDRIMSRNGLRKNREQRERESWENFGKPGREPEMLGGVIGAIAGQDHWIPHLKMARLRTQWSTVVGDTIASHSWVEDYRDGVLTIRAESPVWATQLTYLVPQLTATIKDRLSGLHIERIVITGPRQAHSRYIRMSRHNR